MGTEISLKELKSSAPLIADFLDRMFPPDFSWREREGDIGIFGPPLRAALPAALMTIQISVLGTALGVIGALVLGFLGAENLTPHWLHHSIKIMLALLRSIPVILLALLFFYALGFGALPGILAIGIHSIGMLGKLFAEDCESVDDGVWEAIDSAGANWFQKIRYAVWPQVAPQFASLSLFRFDMNIRESAVLGLVGVEGLGKLIENYRKIQAYDAVATFVIITMIIVIIADQISFHIRRRLK